MTRPATLAVFLLAACAGGKDIKQAAADSVASPVAAVVDSSAAQTASDTVPPDSIAGEVGRIDCNEVGHGVVYECAATGSVKRTGDSLFVRLATGRVLTFVDEVGGEAPGGYYYNGRIGNGVFDVVESWGHEAPAVPIIINRRTGKTVRTSDQLILSPDGGRFANFAPDWNNCAERSQPTMDIWRLTDSIPVRELRLSTFDCGTKRGWGAIDVAWRGTDTVEFTRAELDTASANASTPRTIRTPGRAVRVGNTWVIRP
jgi:hypothetical protein